VMDRKPMPPKWK